MKKETREKLFEFFKEAYFFQFERREKINGRTGILLAIVTLAAGIGTKYLDDLPAFDGSLFTIAFYVLLLIAVFMGAGAFVYLLKSLAQTLTWHYVPTPSDILAAVERLEKRNPPGTPPVIDSLEIFETKLLRQFAEAATHNDVSNDIKNRYLLRTTQWTAATIIALIVCAPFFYSLKYGSAKPPQRIEIVKPIPSSP
jgi:hypothetical protein